MTETVRREFEDADLTHPWATKYRLPLVTNPFPRWKYQVALVVPSSDEIDQGLYHAVWPTEEEAQVLASLLEFTMGYYNASWRAGMRERALDVDSSVNTLIFLKSRAVTEAPYIPRPAMWSYRRATWDRGPTMSPYWETPVGELARYTADKTGLINLLDNKVEPWNGTVKWDDWKAEHPEVFGGAA